MPYETRGRSRGKDPFIINLDDKRRYVVNITARPIYPGTNCIKGWVDLTTGLDGYGEEKICFPPPVFDPRTVQHVASRVGICADLNYTQKRNNELNN